MYRYSIVIGRSDLHATSSICSNYSCGNPRVDSQSLNRERSFFRIAYFKLVIIKMYFTNRLQRLKSPPQLHAVYGECRRDEPLSIAACRNRNDSGQYVYRCPEHQAMCARYSNVCDNASNVTNIGSNIRYHSDNSSDQLSPL